MNHKLIALNRVDYKIDSDGLRNILISLISEKLLSGIVDSNFTSFFNKEDIGLMKYICNNKINKEYTLAHSQRGAHKKWSGSSGTAEFRNDIIALTRQNPCP